MTEKASAELFMDALSRMAKPSPDLEGGHVFRTRNSTVCIAKLLPAGSATVRLKGLTGVRKGFNGREAAAGAMCFLADLFNVTLFAEKSVFLRDAGGKSDDPSWLSKFGFIGSSGDAVFLRMPMTLKNGRPDW